MSFSFDHSYRDVLRDIIAYGVSRENRTGVITRALPSAMVRHNLSLGFPLLTLKRTPFKSITVELEGFIKGITDKRWYQARGCTIWDEWCSRSIVPYGTDEVTKARMKAEPDLGPIYGAQWRNFNGRDQLLDVLRKLEDDRDSRRMLVSAWNPADLAEMALDPCHVIWQVLVFGNTLHLNWYQRSADWFLGVPFNMASYALLASLLANQFSLNPGTVTGFFGDTHLYENQIALAVELARREPKEAPSLLSKRGFGLDILSWTHADSSIFNYDPHPAMKVEVVV